MHRLIVTSATYRQRSEVTPELTEKDPANRLLAHGARFRLPAELIRDQALAVSGLLCENVGGPSVFPLQPEGIWTNPYSGEKWKPSLGGDRYRRGLYTFRRRSTPNPQIMAFDGTTREASCSRRSRTNTPLQALTTLNDPSFVQPAGALARRAIQLGGNAVESRIGYIFRAVWRGRPRRLKSPALRRFTRICEALMRTTPPRRRRWRRPGLTSRRRTFRFPNWPRGRSSATRS